MNVGTINPPPPFTLHAVLYDEIYVFAGTGEYILKRYFGTALGLRASVNVMLVQ